MSLDRRPHRFGRYDWHDGYGCRLGRLLAFQLLGRDLVGPAAVEVREPDAGRDRRAADAVPDVAHEPLAIAAIACVDGGLVEPGRARVDRAALLHRVAALDQAVVFVVAALCRQLEQRAA